MVIYADIIFLRELLMDSLILLLAGWIRHIQIKTWRLLTASGIGALYTIAMLLPNLSSLYHFAIKLFVSFIMIYICFGFYSIQHFVKQLVSFYLVSFVLAGGLMGLHYMLLSHSQQVWANLIFIGGNATAKLEMSLFYVIMTTLCIGFVWIRYMRSRQRSQLLEQNIAEVELHIANEIIHCKGLIDTGNQLFDPLTKTPVMIIEIEQLAHLLPSKLVEQIKQGDMNRVLVTITDDQEMERIREQIRIIPYRGVNRNSQFMIALKPKFIRVTHNETVHETVKVLIGFDGGQLSTDDSYQMIVHPSILSNQLSAL